ncbi:MAG: PAS domain-containing protein [Candidatus Rokubacteria bacterium]|nr:PAS domain-containing protein [Candidatus Rokubacteria bacterium]
MSQISLLLLSAVQIVLALFVWRAQPQSVMHRRFAGQTLLLAIWVLSIAGLQGRSALDLWSRIAFAGASLIPAAFLAFTACYPIPTPAIPQSLLRLCWVAGASFAVLALTTDFLVLEIQLTPTGPARKSGPLYPLFALYFLVAFIVALGVFLSRWSRARGRERAQLQYLAVGITVSAAGGIGTNLILPLVTGRSAYNWLGPHFSLCLVALTAHAIIRHRLMDIRWVAHRGLIYSIVIGGASGVAMAVGKLVAPDWTSQTVTISYNAVAILSAAVLVFSPAGQRFIHRVVDPYLYRGHPDHAAGLRLATHRLSQLMEPVALAQRLHGIIAEAFIPESFTMVAKASDRGEMEILVAAPEELAERLSSHRGFSSLMRVPTSTGPTVLSCSMDLSDPQLRATLGELGVEILVCLQRRDQLLGMLLLGPRRSGDAYYKSDLAFIESLAELASIALDNALLYRQKLQMIDYSERLVESIDSAVVAVDAQGRITSSNAAARRMFAFSTLRLLTLDGLPSEVAWALALALVEEWAPREVEISVDHTLKGTLPLILSAVTLRDEKSVVVGALVVATDLSRVKALERDQRRIERLSTMARFYAGIAHEVRSPLASISNFIAMLPDRFDDPEYRDTAVRLLPNEVARIVRLADRLRSMAPSDGGMLAPVRLQPLLADIVAIHAPAAAETGVVVQLRSEDDLPQVAADASQLVQLFVNLLRNAVEAMPSGGTVTIEARRDRDSRQPNRLTVAISDEGSGIDPPLRAQVFAPFFTTKPSGTGLGLTICREIVEFHGASLSLIPRLGRRGTTALVSFPVTTVSDGQLGPLVVPGRQLTGPASVS